MRGNAKSAMTEVEFAAWSARFSRHAWWTPPDVASVLKAQGWKP